MPFEDESMQLVDLRRENQPASRVPSLISWATHRGGFFYVEEEHELRNALWRTVRSWSGRNRPAPFLLCPLLQRLALPVRQTLRRALTSTRSKAARAFYWMRRNENTSGRFIRMKVLLHILFPSPNKKKIYIYKFKRSQSHQSRAIALREKETSTKKKRRYTTHKTTIESFTTLHTLFTFVPISLLHWV